MDTRLFPCVIERLPEENVGICACYELDEASNTRQGEISIFEIDPITRLLKTRNSIKLDSGVLDCKVLNSILYAALSTEQLNSYLISSEHDYLIESESVSKEGEGLFLSVSACKYSSESSNTSIAASTQEGSVLVYERNERGPLQEVFYAQQAHKLGGAPIPAWIVSLDPHHQSILVSGGDDCKFRLWDTRLDNNTAPTTAKTFHDAGVTTAEWHPTKENILLLGSYDESISVWDIRNIKKPLLHHSTGGGVWRSKWLKGSDHPNNEDFVTTANMQGGCNVYQFQWSKDDSSIELTNSVHFHDQSEKHLSYGIDIMSTSHTSNENNESALKLLLASCSFYDRRLSLWDAEITHLKPVEIESQILK